MRKKEVFVLIAAVFGWILGLSFVWSVMAALISGDSDVEVAIGFLLLFVELVFFGGGIMFFVKKCKIIRSLLSVLLLVLLSASCTEVGPG